MDRRLGEPPQRAPHKADHGRGRARLVSDALSLFFTRLWFSQPDPLAGSVLWTTLDQCPRYPPSWVWGLGLLALATAVAS